MKRPKWTTRRLMLVVFGLAIASGLGIPAVRIFLDSGYHNHTRLTVSPDGQERFLSAVFVKDPFWPRYLRYLQGRPWRDQPLCEHSGESSGEVCELAHPEIMERQADGTVTGIDLSPVQRAEFERLRNNDPTARAYGLNRRPIP